MSPSDTPTMTFDLLILSPIVSVAVVALCVEEPHITSLRSRLTWSALRAAGEKTRKPVASATERPCTVRGELLSPISDMWLDLVTMRRCP